MYFPDVDQIPIYAACFTSIIFDIWCKVYRAHFGVPVIGFDVSENGTFLPKALRYRFSAFWLRSSVVSLTVAAFDRRGDHKPEGAREIVFQVIFVKCIILVLFHHSFFLSWVRWCFWWWTTSALAPVG